MTEYFSFEDYSKIKEPNKGEDTGLTEDGTWGLSAAGILIVTENLKEVLLVLRSKVSTDPNLWGIPGGARKIVDENLEDPLVRAIVEAREELGNLPVGKIRANPYVFSLPDSDFTYFTYILEISNDEKLKFVPLLNWEHSDWKWFSISEVKNNPKLHRGLTDLFIHYDF
jgi:8-oxo-dGTP pyrophosphatase MutT (NUDIX family)